MELNILNLPCRLSGRLATGPELRGIHSEAHVVQYFDPKEQRVHVYKREKSVGAKRRNTLSLDSDITKLMPCGGLGIGEDTVWNPEFTALSASVAAGTVLNLVSALLEKQVLNGFALVRPPGHHAEPDAAMGFCIFNNVAVAAQQILEEHPGKRIMIIDWYRLSG